MDKLMEDLVAGLGDEHCYVCKKRVHGNVKLFGDRIASLCNEHANDWHEYITAESCFIYGTRFKVKMNVAVQSGNELRALELHKKLLAQLTIAYEKSGLWLQDKHEMWIKA